MHLTQRPNLWVRLISGALTLGLFIATSSVCHASADKSAGALKPSDGIQATPECGKTTQLAYFPGGRGIRGPVYHYGYGWNPWNAPQAPTTRTIKNNLWQSHQWKGEYPVCQPLYAPNFGHFQTQWHRFPGDECFDSPSIAVHPF